MQNPVNSQKTNLGVYLFVLSGACAYYLTNAPALLGYFDLGWHLAAGDLIRQQGSVPLQDPWSFTSAGDRWFNLSWLWDVLASAIYQRAHFHGLVILTVAFGAAIAGWLTFLTLKAGATPLSACIAILSACLLYPSFSSFPNIYLATSPNMVTMLFSVIFLGEGLRPSRRLLFLPVLMLLWANLHGGFMLGLFLIGFFSVGALLRRRRSEATLLLIAGSFCFAATFINPLGWEIYRGVSGTLGNPVQAHIGEWKSYFYNFIWPGSVPGLLYIAIFVAAELRYRAACPLEIRLLSWLFLFGGVYQFRYMAFFFLFSAIPLALSLDRLLVVSSDVSKTLAVAGLALTCALPIVYFQALPSLGLPQMVSKGDAQYLKDHFPHARMLNNWNLGGLLIFYDRGSVPLFVDGRAATVYPRSLLQDYDKVGRTEVNGSDWDMVLQKYRIDTIVWLKTHDDLRRFLVGARGWKEAYTGDYVSIYVRPRPRF